MGLYFTRIIASVPCQSSHSRVQVPQNSGPYITVSFETPSNLQGRLPVFISPRNRVAQLYPGNCIPFSSLLTTRGDAVEALHPASTWVSPSSSSSSSYICYRRWVGQFFLVSCPFRSGWPDITFLWVAITFLLFQVGRPLWREDGSVISSAMTKFKPKLYCDRPHLSCL
jgi:hypothetical protein